MTDEISVSLEDFMEQLRVAYGRIAELEVAQRVLLRERALLKSMVRRESSDATPDNSEATID